MKIALVAGESSGDLLGGGLIAAIRERVPDAEFEAVAGPAMRAAGATVLEDADALAVMGFIDPLKVLPKLLRLRSSLLARWSADPPDVFIGIDAPDFNLGLARKLKGHGVPTVQYVSPSVWAWRQGRVKKIRRSVDAVLCLLPFEPKFFADHDVQAVFVGHPRASRALCFADRAAARAHLGLRAEGPLLAILPGSRGGEVEHLAEPFARAAALLRKPHPEIRFVVPVAKAGLRGRIEEALRDAGVLNYCDVLDGDSEAAMAAADLVLLASGTATLEAALLGRPMVVAYRVGRFTAGILRTFNMIKTDKVSLPNLLTETPLVPEFIQDEVGPAALADAVSAILSDPARSAAIEHRFATLRTELALDADQRAAEAVLRLARKQAQ